jgi:hypothetical protein
MTEMLALVLVTPEGSGAVHFHRALITLSGILISGRVSVRGTLFQVAAAVGFQVAGAAGFVRAAFASACRTVIAAELAS